MKGTIGPLKLIPLVSLLFHVSAFGEGPSGSDPPRRLQGNLPLFVCSYPGGGQGRLFKFDSQTGDKLAELAGTSQPVDVDITENGDILVSDAASGQSNVRRFDPETGVADPTPYGQTSAKLGGPRGLAIDPDAHLFVADMRFTSATVVEFDEMGEWVRDLPDDSGVLCAIEDVTCDADGRIFVTQWDDGITCLTPGVYRFTGAGWTLFGKTDNLVAPWGLAFGPDGDLYVAEDSFDASGVFRYDGNTGASKGVYGDTGQATKLGQPRYLTFGPEGDLHVTDAYDHSIRKFSGPLKPDAGAFKSVFAQTSASDFGPFGLAFGAEGLEPQQPELAIEELHDGAMLITLTGTDGKTYELKYTSDMTISDFTEWTLGAIITLEGQTSDTWTDDTAPASTRRFYAAQEQ